MSTTQTGPVVPAVNDAALAAIPDPNTRAVLQQVVGGWNTRNGQTGNGDNAFVTRADLGLTTAAGGQISGVSFNPLGSTSSQPSAIASLLAAIQASVLSDPFYQSLGTRIAKIDTNITDLGLAATEAMIEAQGANAGIVTETKNRQTADQSMQSTMTTQFAKYDGNIAALQTSVTTTADSVSALTTSTSQQFAQVNGNISSLTTTVTTNASTVEALTTSTSTQFAQVNANVGAIYNYAQTTANTVAAQANSISILQSTVGQQSASIAQEASTRANVDGTLLAQYSVKVDVNGYVSGFGFSSTANNSTPSSEFIVRADRFVIGSPNGPGIAPATPFIVYTTPQSAGSTIIQPGVYMNNAYIANASIDTLRLGGNAVTVPSFISGFGGADANGAGSLNGPIASITLNFPDTASIVAVVSWQCSNPGGATNSRVQLRVDGNPFLDNSNSATGGFTSSFTAAGRATVGGGQHTFTFHVGNDWSSGSWALWNWSVLLLGVMR